MRANCLNILGMNLIQLSQSLVKLGDEFLEVHGPQVFHEKAFELLTKHKLHEFYDFENLVETSLKQDFNPSQNYGQFQFSDLPITLARGEHCFLDLYFWRRRPTVIHDHHFTGAFQCLKGVNVDFEFEYFKKQDLDSFHDMGELKLKQVRHLREGDVAAIDLLDKFIHQNHHQDDLTVNLCFRTPDIGNKNLSNYLYSGLRFEKDPVLLNRINRLIAFAGMGNFDQSKLELTLDDAIYFLISTYRSEFQNSRLNSLKKLMDEKVKNQTGLDINALLNQHELSMDQLENDYN